jgi:polar amino acid transport system permease protein
MEELIQAAEEIMATNGILWPLLYTGVFYLFFSAILTKIFEKLENSLNYYK